MNESRIAEILKGFELYDGIYKRAEVEAALELQEEITPHLIAVLEGVLAEPSKYVPNENYYAHIYALILLTHFREQAAHRVIVELFSLPYKIIDPLFGELISDTLPIALFSTCHGEVELIKSLVLNREADQYSRGSASRAMVFAATDGMIEREEVLAFFGSLFTGDEAAPDSMFWSFLAYYACQLYPEGLMGVIEKAYEDKLISPGFVEYEEFQETLKRGKEQTLTRMQYKLQRSSVNDVHQYMSWWAAFKQEKPTVSPTSPTSPTVSGVAPTVAPSIAPSRKIPSNRPPVPPKSSNKAKKKKKRKKAKASRKKRRR